MTPRPTGAPSKRSLKSGWTAGPAPESRLPLPPPPRSPLSPVDASGDFATQSRLVPALHSSSSEPPPSPRGRSFWIVRAWRWLPWWIRKAFSITVLYVSFAISPAVWMLYRLFTAPDRAARDAVWDTFVVHGVWGMAFSEAGAKEMREMQATLEATYFLEQDRTKAAKK